MRRKADGTIELSWAAPEHPLEGGEARRSILGQHVHIRALLDRARAVAEAALSESDGTDEHHRAAAATTTELRETMEIHLAYEERVLLPLLQSDLPLGPLRAEALLAEHRHQRKMLAIIDQEARVYPPLPLLATKLAFLSDWLLVDMEEEESSLLNPDVVRDDAVVVDQICG